MLSSHLMCIRDCKEKRILMQPIKHGPVLRLVSSIEAIQPSCSIPIEYPSAMGCDHLYIPRRSQQICSNLSETFHKYFPEDFQILPSSDITITVTSSWYFLRSPCGMSSNSWKSIPAGKKCQFENCRSLRIPYLIDNIKLHQNRVS